MERRVAVPRHITDGIQLQIDRSNVDGTEITLIFYACTVSIVDSKQRLSS